MGLAKRGEKLNVSRHTILATVAVMAVLAVVIVGVVLSGSPKVARLQKLDDQRLDRVRNLSYEVQMFYDRNGQLPMTLAELASAKSGEMAVDPITGQAFEYRRMNDTTYEICAVFDAPSPSIAGKNTSETRPVDDPILPGYDYDLAWRHGAGHHCFSKEVSTTGTWPVVRAGCGVQAPCGAGYDCVILPNAATAVCVKQGTACAEAGCPTGCVIAESYPAIVRCDERAATGLVDEDCALWQNPTGQRVDCFGCANGICKEPPDGWELYDEGAVEIGIPYACYATESGCALAQ